MYCCAMRGFVCVVAVVIVCFFAGVNAVCVVVVLCAVSVCAVL